ncbi:hypothetical protein C0Q70_12992 [Pomacea canaliculata]|uniref:Ig-like domain-containing protein n=1 Tax=Pomacea canaliculata TaxID=400727 RepID=A0A2T7P334_POMCA|nr:hypothetical protein C0Q70_12992 [Pomacea canaliculata]
MELTLLATCFMLAACAKDVEPEQVRLTGTDLAAPDTGRVEIQLDSEWFTVIVPDDNFAKVVCNQSGLPSKEAVVTQASSFTRSQSTQLMVHLDCKGNESSILDCDQLTDSESCRKLDFGVICSDREQLNPRLVNGSSSFNGLLEVSHNGSYVKVCSHMYLNTLAFVACKTLGLNSSNALAVHHSMYGDSKGTQFMAIDCLGRENSLTNCQHGLINNAYCSTDDSIGVICSNHQPSILITSNLTTCRPQPPQNVCVVTHNTSVTIVCDADSNPPPANITWSGPVSSGTQELHLTPANSSTHQGFYTCSVFTPSSDEDERLPLSSNYTFAVVIQGAPKLEDMDAVVNISNSKGRLSFKMTSYPAPTNVTFQNVAASKASKEKV